MEDGYTSTLWNFGGGGSLKTYCRGGKRTDGNFLQETVSTWKNLVKLKPITRRRFLAHGRNPKGINNLRDQGCLMRKRDHIRFKKADWKNMGKHH